MLALQNSEVLLLSGRTDRPQVVGKLWDLVICSIAMMAVDNYSLGARAAHSSHVGCNIHLLVPQHQRRDSEHRLRLLLVLPTQETSLAGSSADRLQVVNVLQASICSIVIMAVDGRLPESNCVSCHMGLRALLKSALGFDVETY